MLIDTANILLAIRPFVCSLAYAWINLNLSLILSIFLLYWLLFKGFPYRRIIPIKYPLMLFCLSLGLAVAFSPVKYVSINAFYIYLPGILLVFFAASLSPEDEERVVKALVQTAFAIAVIAIYQYFFGLPHLMQYLTKKQLTNPFTLEYIRRQRAFFPFVTPNILAGYLAMSIPLILSYRKNWLVLFAVSLAILLTKSIGALLSLFLGLAIYFQLTGKMNKKFWGLTALFLVMIFLLLAIRQSSLPHRQITFSFGQRLVYWQDTLQIIKMHPLTGSGLGNFDTHWSRYAHNSYLQIWAEAGPLGIISFLWLIAAIIASGLKNLKSSKSKNQVAALLSVSAIFLLHNVVDLSFFLPESAFLWWLTAGLLAKTENAKIA